MSNRKAKHIDSILTALGELGESEARVLAKITEGLLTGQRKFGAVDLRTDSRHFGRERNEELRDSAVYLQFQIEAERELERSRSSCRWCRAGLDLELLDEDGTRSSVSGRPGTWAHAFDDAWWRCDDPPPVPKGET